MIEAIPLLSILVVLPAVGALVTSRTRSPTRSRAVAFAFALATLGIAVAIMILLHGATSPRLVEVAPPIDGLGARWHLGIDGLSAPFLPLAALIACAVLIGAPSRELDGGGASAVLIVLATTIGVYCSLDLLLLVAFWIASLVPGALRIHHARSGDVRQRLARTYDVFLVLGSLPMIAAVLLIGWARTRAGAELPFDLASATTAPVPVASQQLVFVLLAFAVLIRSAIAPFHVWLPVLIERGPVGIAVMIAGTHLGAFLIARVMIPLLPDAARADLPIVATLALASALYSALVAICQTDLRRALGFVITSQVALVVVGLAEANAESVHGAMLQMLGIGLSATGLVLAAAALEVRAGTSDTERFGGLATRMPRLAASFLLLAIGAIGLPGSLQFVAEDLLLRGLLASHPIVAVLLLLAGVLNGITLLRLFFRLFYGPVRDARVLGPGAIDLRPRESLALTAIVVLTVAAGIAPSALLAMRADAVRALSIADAAPSEVAARSHRAGRAR
ncbi:MAG: hypothetical protein M3Y87_17280 [Myxococcota bacterium]|nr:hypothetical protein [Myxococcota bacterium]